MTRSRVERAAEVNALARRLRCTGQVDVRERAFCDSVREWGKRERSEHQWRLARRITLLQLGRGRQARRSGVACGHEAARRGRRWRRRHPGGHRTATSLMSPAPALAIAAGLPRRGQSVGTSRLAHPLHLVAALRLSTAVASNSVPVLKITSYRDSTFVVRAVEVGRRRAPGAVSTRASSMATGDCRLGCL